MRWSAGVLAILVPACSGGGGADSPDAEVADAAPDAPPDGPPVWPACGPGWSRAAGTPCGPDAPCQVVRDELIDAPAFRNDAPAIAVDAADRPHVLFSVAESGYHGFYARRDDAGAWSVEPAMTLATAALVLDADDVARALVNDGALGTRLWHRDGGGWQPDESLADQGGWAQGLVTTRDGCLYAPLIGDDFRPRLGGRDPDGTWTVQVVGDHADGAEAIAIAPDGTPHMLGWQTDGQPSWGSYWSTPDQPSALVHTMNSNVLEWLPFSLAVTASGPHLLHSGYNGSPPAVYGTTLLYSQRRPDGTWDERLIAEGDPDEFGGFETGPGDYTTYRGFATVASGDDVRLLYARYVITDGAIAARLELAWPTATGVATQVVADPIEPRGLTAAVDSQGRIHVALYDGAAAWSDSAVRYLLLAPGGRR